MPIFRSHKKLTLTTLLAALVIGAFGLIAIGTLLWWLWPESKHTGFGYISTIAGTGKEFGEPFGIAVKGKETFISDGQSDNIWRLGSKGLTVFAEKLDTPSAIAFLPDGDLIVADTGSHTIKRISAKSEITPFAGVPGKSGFLDGDAAGALFNGPTGLAVSRDGKVFVADTYNDRIRVIAGGQVTTLAGGGTGFADGTGSETKFDTPTGLAMWKDTLLVADSGNRRIRAVEPHGRVWTLAGPGDADPRNDPSGQNVFVQPTALAVHSDGTIFLTDGNAIREISGDTSRSVRTISASDARGLRDGDWSDAEFNRPMGLALDGSGELLVADSENRLVRKFSHGYRPGITSEQIAAMRDTAEEFRNAAPGRWPFDPPERPRDIAGTLGEVRGDVSADPEHLWFHNGLDIAGGYGETATFIRDEKVLRPIAAENFGTLRELLRMPTLGYIHLRLGRDSSSSPFRDARFQFQRDDSGKLSGVRVPRGTKFKAGDAIGTLNSMNHVHLIAGRSGSELNALDALELPGVSDSRPPVTDELKLYNEDWTEIETPKPNSRIRLSGKTRIVVRAYDQMDGNSERRRLGVYRVSWGIRRDPPAEHAVMAETRFDRMPSNDLVTYAYAVGSKSGATGETIFRYIATNSVNGEQASQGFLDPATLENGNYTVAVVVADRFGNTATREFLIEVMR